MHGKAREWIRVVAFVVVFVDVLVQPWQVEHAVEPVEMGVAVGIENQNDQQHLPSRYLGARTPREPGIAHATIPSVDGGVVCCTDGHTTQTAADFLYDEVGLGVALIGGWMGVNGDGGRCTKYGHMAVRQR